MIYLRNKYYLIFVCCLGLFLGLSCEKQEDENPEIITETILEPGLLINIENVSVTPVFARQGRTIKLQARIFSNIETEQDLNIRIKLPEYISLLEEKDSLQKLSLGFSREASISWEIVSSKAISASYVIKVDNGEKFNSKTFLLKFRTPREIQNASYVPTPVKAESEYHIGAFRCPLWYEGNRPGCWRTISRSFPERAPVLGFYNEANPEVIDWEIKYASEHGISFFVDCWYRDKANEGKSPVIARLDHWVKALKETRYKDMIKFALLWENTNGIASGIASEEDLLLNLLPYWIDNYFNESNYMMIDGKPILYVYGYSKFIEQLGGQQNAKAAVIKMNQAMKDAGFNGIYLMAVHNLHYRNNIGFLKDVGFESVVSYHVPTFTGEMNSSIPPSQAQIVTIQETCWNKLKSISSMTTYPVISMGWDSAPWGFSYSKGQWAITGENYRNLCAKAKSFTDYLPDGNKIIMLDNWNEFGEGHFIAPTQKYGFEFLNIIAETFSSSMDHDDIVPEDVGLGPYEYPIGE